MLALLSMFSLREKQVDDNVFIRTLMIPGGTNGGTQGNGPVQ